MRFVETPVFTEQIVSELEENSYHQLQLALLLRPEQGALIRGSGGLRKLRWGVAGRGKRGGVRVIYFWYSSEEIFYMLYVYPKNVQGDLTPAQIRILRRLVEEEFK
jgi:mRNA-degrading endonuclease RelE of RelBE toxin-antitoxin system